MTTPKNQIQKWWPEPVKRSFEETLKQADDGDSVGRRLRALLCDPRMRPVVDRLLKVDRNSSSDIGNRVLGFIFDVAHAPETWRQIRSKSPRAHRRDVAEFKRATARFRHKLKKHRGIVGYALSYMPSRHSGKHGYPLQVLEEILQFLDQEEMGFDEPIEHRRNLSLVPPFVSLPQKWKHPNAEQVFCINHIAETWGVVFESRAPNSVVATLVTVALGLEEAVTAERVKELRNYRLKKRGKTDFII